jgi:hypothetical protein
VVVFVAVDVPGSVVAAWSKVQLYPTIPDVSDADQENDGVLLAYQVAWLG